MSLSDTRRLRSLILDWGWCDRAQGKARRLEIALCAEDPNLFALVVADESESEQTRAWAARFYVQAGGEMSPELVAAASSLVRLGYVVGAGESQREGILLGFLRDPDERVSEEAREYLDELAERCEYVNW